MSQLILSPNDGQLGYVLEKANKETQECTSQITDTYFLLT